MHCRHCNTCLEHTLIDLGFAPPSNAYLKASDLKCPETYYPLRVKVCHACWLVQTEDYAEVKALFSSDYAYFSSTSAYWLKHAAQYAKAITEQLKLDSESFVIEIASNDGYLLKNFVEFDIPCLGIEPTNSTADVAETFNIPVLREFFSESLARNLADQNKLADLIVCNNVYAHVPDINDFTRGLKVILKPQGSITIEFPHLLSLMYESQFDTIYHEHFSYLSLSIVCRIFKSVGLRIFDVEKISTHGGSLRVYGCHENDARSTQERVTATLLEEKNNGLNQLNTYQNFQAKAESIKYALLEFLIEQKKLGKRVVAYGAAAKGNTLLNFAGIKSDLLPYVFDATKAKQGKYMPGSHIPILPPEKLHDTDFDYVLILPWNFYDDIRYQYDSLNIQKQVKFVKAIPELTFL